MTRVLLVCSDAVLLDSLRNSFRTKDDFDVCGDAKDRVEAIGKVMKLFPDLVILEMELLLRDSFETAEELKLIMPKVPLFLITGRHGAQAEKEALSHGIDAVFEKNHDFTSLVMNARAICGPD
jgi:DNA-binding NarL/FixJ family response regulator